MSRRLQLIGVLALIATIGAFTPAVVSAAGVPAAPTFTKDIAPIFQEKCEACHRPDSIAPMSLRDLRRGASVGARRSRRASSAPDAALAHRQDGRHPGVQERSVAHATMQIATIVKWIDRARRRATRRTCRRRVVADEQGWNFAEHVRPDRAGSDHPVHAVDAEGRRERRLVEAGRRDRAHRAALGARDRNPPGHASRAARSRITPSRGSSRKKTDRRRQHELRDSIGRRLQHRARSWSGRSASRARSCGRTPAS